MLKAQVERIDVEDKEENCHANHLSLGHTVTHAHMCAHTQTEVCLRWKVKLFLSRKRDILLANSPQGLSKSYNLTCLPLDGAIMAYR